MVEIISLTSEKAGKLRDFLEQIFGIEYRALTDQYIRCMFSSDYRRPTFLVALKDGKVIGSAAYSEEIFTVDVWGISWVAVAPDYRHQGIGQRLIDACLSEISATAKHPVSVILATYPQKTQLYEKVGFAKACQTHEDGWFMAKSLK